MSFTFPQSTLRTPICVSVHDACSKNVMTRHRLARLDKSITASTPVKVQYNRTIALCSRHNRRSLVRRRIASSSPGRRQQPITMQLRYIIAAIFVCAKVSNAALDVDVCDGTNVRPILYQVPCPPESIPRKQAPSGPGSTQH
jgi:hypothetical protein